MANRFTHRSRALLAAVALVGAGTAAVVVPTSASAQPGPHRDPSIPSVQKRLGALALQNDQLVEQYNQATVNVGRRDHEAAAAAAIARTARQRYATQRVAFVRMVQAQFEGQQSFGAASALLDSNSGTNYIDRLNTLDVMTSQSAQVVKDVANSRSLANAASAKANGLLATARQERTALSSKRDKVQKQINKYRAELDKLTAAQQAKWESSGAVNVGHMHLTKATSAAARRAVDFALKQVGKPYVFGAAGPGSYDCSGLTMAAWQHGGVSLPHSAADQYNYGHHVGRDELEPGDLIFFYQPIGHVTIYIGDGLMVSAPTEGEPVQVVSVSQFNSDYTGATRLVG